MLNTARNRQGIALPLALLGLLVVTFLVVSAIVTSGAELTGSSTHQRATAALYDADAALERYIAIKAAAGAAHTDSLIATDGDPLIPGFMMHVGRLVSDIDTVGGASLHQDEVYSVIALPEGGRGRSVGAFIATERDTDAFFLNVSAGLTVGGDATIAGNSTISDGSDNLTACAQGGSEHAIQVSAGSEITKQGSANIVGTADTATFTQAEMVQQVLGGLTIQEAVALSSVKLTAAEFNRTPRSYDVDGPRPRSDKFNWGCPATHACAAVAGNHVNVDYFPMVAIDAQNGKVTIGGDHGQGVLIIYNGSAEIDGNMVYNGIIVVERDLMVRGTVQIQGAVVALGENSTLEDDLTGTATVTYNQCVNERAQASANDQRIANAPQFFPERTTNWFEFSK